MPSLQSHLATPISVATCCVHRHHNSSLKIQVPAGFRSSVVSAQKKVKTGSL